MISEMQSAWKAQCAPMPLNKTPHWAKQGIYLANALDNEKRENEQIKQALNAAAKRH